MVVVLRCLVYEMKNMKIFMKTKFCLILAIILKILDFMILFNKKVIGKMKGEVR